MCMYEYEYESQVPKPWRSRKRWYSAELHAGSHEASAAIAGIKEAAV